MNRIAAVVAYLLSLPEVTGLCNQHVYGVEIPEDVARDDLDDDLMPPPTIVIGALPSTYYAREYMSVGWSLNDLRCYGRTLEGAIAVWNVAYRALKMMPMKTTAGGVRLYSASPVAGVTTREPESNWPVCYGTFELLASEVS